MDSFSRFVQHVFLSPKEPRLRAGWRLLLQIILWFAFTACLGIPVFLLSQSPTITALLNSIVNLFAVTLSVALARRFLDRRSFVSLGLAGERHTVPDILAGIAITCAMMGWIYLTMRALGWIQAESFVWQAQPTGSGPSILANTLLWGLIFTMVGWQEELLCRGYHLQTIAGGTNLTWGAILSSLIFGVLHLGNPGATWQSTLGICLAGLFLAYGYLRTGRLWLPVGLHIGWNFFEGVVFGFPVSGLETYRLMQTTVNGPALWTGGAFGPEGGLLILPAMAIGSFLIYLYTRRRSRPSLSTP